MLRTKILVPLALTALEACRDQSPTGTATANTSPDDGIIALESGSVHFHCSGSGSPTVVFDSAIGQDGTAWNKVAPAVADVTRACVYDRKGTGYSAAPASRPHTNRQMADELHQLLERAGVRGPYVVVGHSVGGINVRLFASAHPSDVAGMVLVDAADDPMPLWSLMPAEAVAKRRAELAAGPEGLDLDAFVAGAAEMHDRSRSIGDKPLVVITRGLADAPPSASAEVAAQWLRVWQEQQSKLVGLSTNSVHIVAERSHHMIPAEAPQLIVAAVKEVVAAARTKGRLRQDALRSG